MFAWDAACFVNATCIMGGVAEVRAVAPTMAVLTLDEWFAVFDVVVIGAAPCTVKGVVAGVVSPGVI